MPLITYEEARPWAKAIKEEVLARRMPKWPIVRGYGDFINDHSLSSFEIALMAAWADGGAPRNLELRTKNSEVSETKGDEPPKNEERRTRKVSLPCDRVRIPPGRLVGLRPSLPAGESLRLTVIRPGREEILLWLKDFDPRFEETYWLRNPVTVTRATQFRAEAAAGCTLTALLETRKRK